jgi:hypothetical protein
MSLHPMRSFITANRELVRGRLHFPTGRIGETVRCADGQEFAVFRQMLREPGPGQPSTPGALFRVRFHVAAMPPRLNRVFSLLPIPFFSGLPGFRSKLWLMDPESGDFMGQYEWDSVEDAENYNRSFAMRFMTRRSVPGSVRFEIHSQ